MKHKYLILLFILSAQLLASAQPTAPAADPEEQREKLLHAADQLDNIQASSEQTRVSVEAMKSDIAKVQQDNQALRQENVTLKAQIEALQNAFDKAEANHAKERQVLLDEVAKMVSASAAKSTPAPKKKEKPAEPVSPADSIDKGTKNADPAPESVPPASPQPTDSSTNSTNSTTNSAPVPITTLSQTTEHTSYKHIVAPGETLTLIAAAYRQQGVKVTVAQIRKANNLAPDSMLQVGQKLLIPKPPTN